VQALNASIRALRQQTGQLGATRAISTDPGKKDFSVHTTVHKAQGTTVDRTYVLATPHFDRHTTCVALSRHREATTMFYAGDDFGGRAPAADSATVEARLMQTLSRARPNELAQTTLSASQPPTLP
jgi:hypothetical protein